MKSISELRQEHTKLLKENERLKKQLATNQARVERMSVSLGLVQPHEKGASTKGNKDSAEQPHLPSETRLELNWDSVRRTDLTIAYVPLTFVNAMAVVLVVFINSAPTFVEFTLCILMALAYTFVPPRLALARYSEFGKQGVVVSGVVVGRQSRTRGQSCLICEYEFNGRSYYETSPMPRSVVESAILGQEVTLVVHKEQPSMYILKAPFFK